LGKYQRFYRLFSDFFSKPPFNKIVFLFFAFVQNPCTFVSSMKGNGGDKERSGENIDT
jgi:hypothetical protein